jgi:hypothetical protein
MVQPYLDGVDADGETGVIYVAGVYSHTVRKAALLRPGQPPGEALYLEEDIEVAEPTRAERALSDRTLAACPSDDLLLARVDLVPGRDGPLVLEVELTEPSLFLGYAPGATERLADAIARGAPG